MYVLDHFSDLSIYYNLDLKLLIKVLHFSFTHNEGRLIFNYVATLVCKIWYFHFARFIAADI